jgi:RimJ/RimL family protein N-acetyltransferase
MSYFGTDAQVALQRRTEGLHDWLYSTPGCCNPGRFCGTDDPDALGWPTIEATLRRDGIIGFRLRPATERAAIDARLRALGFEFHAWDVFLAGAAEASGPSRTCLDPPLPEGLSDHVLASDDPQERVTAIQAFLAANAIAPFSGRMLRGELGPAATPYVSDATGRIVACAHAYLPHNRHSPHARAAWVGLVAVDPDQRGRQLGRRVNARAIAMAIDALGAETIYELVAPDNEASRRMVESCGPRRRADLLCGIASSRGPRFTR